MSLQGTLFPPTSLWRPPRLSDLPSDWRVFRRVAVDTETNDAKLKLLGPGVRRGAYIAGISFAVSDQQAWYLPLRHLGGDNMEDPDQALAYVRDQAAQYDGEIVGAKLGYDLDFLAQAGVHFPRATFRDVQVAEPLLDELQYSYSLDNILARHGLRLKDESLLREAAAAFRIDPKAEMWKMPARFVGRYAEVDVIRPLQLLEKQELEIERQGLRRAWDLESAVLPLLVRMRRRGVRVNCDKLDAVERFARAEESVAWGQLHRLTGVSVAVGDAMKPGPLARALETQGIKVGLTAQGKPSITKGFLDHLNHPAGQIIRRARQMSQLRTTFVASIRAHAVNGRVHTTFNQIMMESDEEKGGIEGVAGVRLSSCDPNMQQQPARDPEIGPMWRDIYEPEPGEEWVSADYSQQEPKLAVHAAVASGADRLGRALGSAERGNRAWVSACEMAQRYHDDPTTDAHQAFTAMVYGEHVMGLKGKELKILRDPMKNVFLGICYGEGGGKLCGDLGYPTKVIEGRNGRKYIAAGDEGQALLNMVDQKAPYLRATAKAVEAVAVERGYILTIGGRRCRFKKDDAGNYDWTYKAFNRYIQNSAAEQVKMAGVELDKEGIPLLLQVHDEYAWSEADRTRARRAAEIMRDVMHLHVPTKVDLEVGPSWGRAKGI